METLPVGKFKTHFSEILERVKQGETIGITYGRKKKPVAMLIPYQPHFDSSLRKIGLLEGKAKAIFCDSFEMTEEELAGFR